MSLSNHTRLDRACDKCDGVLMATVCSAAHDDSLLDIVVECEECARITNAFIKMADLQEIE